MIMFTHMMTFLTSVTVSGSFLIGSLILPLRYNTTAQKQTPLPVVDNAPGQQFDLALKRLPRFWPFQGDRIVHKGLINATAEVTGLEPEEVVKSLKENKSLADIATEQGKTIDEVLAAFDKKTQEATQKAVEEGKLPESLANSRAEWFQAEARKLVILPGMRPWYPGLQELNAMIMTAAVRVSGMKRAEVRAELEKCRTLNEILVDKGKTGQDAVDQTMKFINRGLNLLLKKDRLTQAQHDEWSADISAALTKMVDMPGLLVAGKECAP
jgi:hypothetical protein